MRNEQEERRETFGGEGSAIIYPSCLKTVALLIVQMRDVRRVSQAEAEANTLDADTQTRLILLLRQTHTQSLGGGYETEGAAFDLDTLPCYQHESCMLTMGFRLRKCPNMYTLSSCELRGAEPLFQQ